MKKKKKNSNFDTIKQRDIENNKVKVRKTNNINNSSGQNDDDIDFAITQMKELAGNVKKLHATYQDAWIYLTP